MNGHDTELRKPTNKIVIPESPELMLRMAEKLIHAHASKGPQSPVDAGLAVQIMIKYRLARERHEEGMAHPERAGLAFEHRDIALGTRQFGYSAEGASLKFYLRCAAEKVAKKHDEQMLLDFGFSA